MSTPTRDPSKLWYQESDDAHRRLIARELRRFGSLNQAMADHLGIGLRTLYREAERLGIHVPRSQR